MTVQEAKDFLESNGYFVSIKTNFKNGAEKTGIMVSLKEGDKFCPFIFEEQLERIEEEDLLEAVKNAMLEVVSAKSSGNVLSNVSSDDLFVQLRRKSTEDVPKKEFLDLEIVMRIRIRISDVGSAVVNNGILEMIGMSEEDAWSIATENTKQAGFKYKDVEELLFGENISGRVMLVVSNEARCLGANALSMFDFDIICNELNVERLFIIPSSIHEVLVVPDYDDNEMSIDELKETVSFVNETELDDREYLSGTVYEYSNGSVKIA